MPRYISIRAIAAILTALAMPHGVMGQDRFPLEAPYQVARVTRDVDRYTPPNTLGSPRVMIDLGSAEGIGWPDVSVLDDVTLIGTAGVTTASLEEVIKVCETLCGDGAEECHYEGRLVPTGSLDAIGTPLAALAGRPALSDFVPVPEATPVRDVTDSDLTDTFTTPIWPDDRTAGLRHRFTNTGAELTLEYAWGSGTGAGQAVPARDCQLHDRGVLQRLTCAGIEALIADRRPILVSFPDYNSPDADLVASFGHDNRTYHLFRFALKVQTVFGLLVRTEEGWRALLRPRDYALLC